MSIEITKSDQEYFDWLKSPAGGNCSVVKKLDESLYAAAKPLMYHWTLMIGMIGDTCSWMDNYCYETRAKVEAALDEWDGHGDPKGWHRNPKTGRRRIKGDPKTEYIAW